MDQLALALSRSVPDEVRTIGRVLSEAGHRSWIVGGAVRDVALAVQRGASLGPRGDFDLATDAKPEDVVASFRKVIPTGIEHGTVTVLIGGKSFEVTTLRGEKGYSDGRRPDEVRFVSEIDEDLARRDFTVNAMAFDFEANTFHDPFGGLDDLRAGVLRAVGKPLERFREDGLRILRCARFCATLNLTIEADTRAAIRPTLNVFARVARERVRDEWFKALVAPQASRFLRVAVDEGMLALTLPFLWSKGRESSPRGVSFDETLQRVDAAPRSEILRLAVFAFLGTTAPTSGSHPSAAALTDALRLSKEQRLHLGALLDGGELPASLISGPTAYGARLFLKSTDRARLDEILTIQRLVQSPDVSSEALKGAQASLAQQLKMGAPLAVRDLAVTGADLMNEADVPRGPEVGRILATLLDHVLEFPENNERQKLLDLARSLAK